MQDAIILGGGISGLTAAYLLQQKGLDISVIEKAPSAGGPIASIHEEGYLVETGPNSLLLPDPWVESFIDELGLEPELQETNPIASKRYIIKDGTPVPVPASPLQAIGTPLFSLKAKLGFLREPFRKRLDDRFANSETVASFVRRRMGSEFLDYAIDPFVSGVHAGDPNELILSKAFPLMRAFERDSGSLIKGALQLRKRRKREGDSFKKRSISFKRGLGILPETIARKLGNRLWLNATIVAINRNDEGWQVTWKQDGENFEGFARNLLVCLPSRSIKRITWMRSIAEQLAATPNLPYPPVHSLALGFRREQIAHPLDGFGMLAPNREQRSTLGTLFSASLYDYRAPKDHTLLTVMIGGRRRTELANKSKDALLEIALNDIRPLLGIEGRPTFTHLSSWPKAIPQYTAAFDPWKRTIDNLEEAFDGLYFGGSSVDGIAMGASLMSGKRLAEAVD